MSGDPQKTPLAQTVSAFANRRALDEIAKTGRALPCRVTAVSGQLVTVAFEVAGALLPSVTIPLAAWAYDWIPARAGDKGVTMPADTRLGGISGQGGGTADLAQTANLSALMFVPCANATWTVPDATQRVVQGPGGVLLQTLDGHVKLNLTETGIAFTVNGKTWSWDASGLTMSNGVVIETHIHNQGVDSHGDTEQPTGAPVNP